MIKDKNKDYACMSILHDDFKTSTDNLVTYKSGKLKAIRKWKLLITFFIRKSNNEM